MTAPNDSEKATPLTDELCKRLRCIDTGVVAWNEAISNAITALHSANERIAALQVELANARRDALTECANLCGSFIRPNGRHTREYATACADLQDAICALAGKQ